MNGACNIKNNLALLPGEVSKGQISLNINNKVNFKDFFFQTVCVLLQLKDIKHIERDFVLTPGSCPTGGTWGGGCAQWHKMSLLTWLCGISN